MKETLGIDVGATSIKGGIVDIEKGQLIGDPLKLYTPDPKKPQDIAHVVEEMIQSLGGGDMPVGIGFPAVIRQEKTKTASNIHSSWIDYPIFDLFSRFITTPFNIINDADAAGLAEIHYGIGKGVRGTVILLTLGTGIGSAVFKNGSLLRNTELGLLKFKDGVAENYASNTARKKFNYTWPEYGMALNEILEYIQLILSPNLIILGGGLSKMYEHYSDQINKNLNVVIAQMQNNAGIVGAAYSLKLKDKK